MDESIPRIRRPYLLFLAFLAGAAVMSLEMAAQRSFSPYFGSTNYIWANIIGALMASLALGYYAGGRIADRWPRAPVLLWLLGSCGAAASFAPLFVHPLALASLPSGITAEQSFRIDLLGSLLLTLLLPVPLVFLLAMAPPFLVRLTARSREESGTAAGRVNAFSAVGSIAGTFLPTLVLIPTLGPRATFALTGAVVAVSAAAGLTFLGAGRLRLAAWALLAPAVPGLLLSARPVHGGPDTLAERESPYQYVRVYEKDGKRFLTLNEGRDQYHSMQIPGRELTDGNYFDYMNLAPLHFDPAVQRRLRVHVVGLAAGIYSRQIHHFFGRMFEVSVDGAEIDPEVLAVSREFFGLSGPGNRNLSAAAADGRLDLATASGTYDLIAVDAYSRQLYIPFHLVTKEFFELCRDRLGPGGIVALNVCDFSSRSPALEAIRNTVASVFGTVYELRLAGTQNYLLYARRDDAPAGLETVRRNLDDPAFASASEAPALRALLLGAVPYRTAHAHDPGIRVLTDDCAPVEALMDASFRRVRSGMRTE